MKPLAARFSLLVGNLLDLSHGTYLHGGYIGTPEVAAPITTEMDEQAGVIYVSRHMDDAGCPPFYANSTGLAGRIARWQDIEYTPPCLYELHSRIPPAGSAPRPDATGLDAFHVEVVYAITPEAEHSTHDFWAVARDFALGDAGVSQFLADSNRTVARQDVDALDVPGRVISAEPDGYQELSVNIDTCGLALAKEMERRPPGVLDELAVGGVVPGAGEQDLQGSELGTDR